MRDRGLADAERAVAERDQLAALLPGHLRGPEDRAPTLPQHDPDHGTPRIVVPVEPGMPAPLVRRLLGLRAGVALAPEPRVAVERLDRVAVAVGPELERVTFQGGVRDDERRLDLVRERVALQARRHR